MSDAPDSYGATASYKYSNALAKKFSALSRYGDPYMLYRKTGDVIHLPRAVCPVGVNDNRSAGQDVKFDCKFTPRTADQTQWVHNSSGFLLAGLSGISQAYTGFGKCLAKGTQVLMHDGRRVNVENVEVGDYLMGPDGERRTVLSTTTGVGPMYRVSPTMGEDFVCNDVHVLSLKKTNVGDNPTLQRCSDMVNVPLDEYLGWPSWKKHIYKLWRTGVEWEPRNLAPMIDPYFMGVLLGDGSTKGSIAVTTADDEIVAEVHRQAALWGLKVRKEDQEDSKSSTYYLSQLEGHAVGGNRLRTAVQSLGLGAAACGDKFIPYRYLTGSREERLQLLAGLIDTDGTHIRTCFDFTVKSRRLADDVAFLARSLGMAATRQTRTGGKVAPNTTYHRVVISGSTHQVPTRLVHKKAPVRVQKKDVLRTGFKVEALGAGDYYGFALDGDHLFLLGDFTVTHNTACSMPVIAAVAKKTLIVCTKEDLMLDDKQWLGSLKTFLNLTDKDIGVVRQDRCDVAGKKVVIGLVHSLSIEGRYPPGTFDDFGLIVWDEVHRVAADTFSNTAFLFRAKLRWGLSATVERSDGKEIILHANIGPTRVKSQPLVIKPKVLHFTSNWHCPRVLRVDPNTGEQKVVRLPHSPGRVTHIIQSLAKDISRNDLICKATMMAYQKKRSIVVFTELLDHIETLRMALKNMGVPWGDMGVYVGGMKAKARDEATVKPITLTTYRMTSEGTNCPWWSCAVFATPRGDVVQIAGRVLREYPDKPQPILIDITDLDSPVFAGYSKSRRNWYRSVGADQVQL